MAGGNNESKICLLCGAEFHRRPGEYPGVWFKRKFCSRFCGMKANRFGDFGKRDKNPRWGGGRGVATGGYITVIGQDGKRKYEHRVIAEATGGRELSTAEHVHHINGIRDDNRPENLEVMKGPDHSRLHSGGVPRPKNSGENSGCWKWWVTKEDIESALSSFRFKKRAARFLGIHPDTLSDRMKYYAKKENSQNGQQVDRSWERRKAA